MPDNADHSLYRLSTTEMNSAILGTVENTLTFTRRLPKSHQPRRRAFSKVFECVHLPVVLYRLWTVKPLSSMSRSPFTIFQLKDVEGNVEWWTWRLTSFTIDENFRTSCCIFALFRRDVHPRFSTFPSRPLEFQAIQKNVSLVFHDFEKCWQKKRKRAFPQNWTIPVACLLELPCKYHPLAEFSRHFEAILVLCWNWSIQRLA